MLTNRNLKQVNRIERQCPEVWIEADNIRLSSERNWDQACYLPIQYWEPIAARFEIDIAHLATLGAWRLTKGIYVTDYSQWTMPTITSDVQLPLPRWCVYVQTADLFKDDRLGFYATWMVQEVDIDLKLWLLIDHGGRRFTFKQWRPGTNPKDLAPYLSILQAVGNPAINHPQPKIVKSNRQRKFFIPYKPTCCHFM
jgi:hypothetical protein